MTLDVLLTNGLIVDGSGRAPYRSDVAVRDGVIVDVAQLAGASAARVIDCSDRHLFPGFIDAHSHTDGSIFRPEVQLALLRQGVTTVVAGQDGVSLAPGDGGYGAEYFQALNGAHPTFDGGDVKTLLATYHHATSVNVGYLVPHSTVRHQVMGFSDRAPEPDELARMRREVATGLEQGALGLSTGLDYVPGRHARSAELAELCRPVAAAGALYVTHMRGGYEDHSAVGVDEVSVIARASGARVHISHYHGRADRLGALIDDARADGIDVSFDSYPYRRGFTFLAMPIVPAALLTAGPGAAGQALGDPPTATQFLTEWFPALGTRSETGPGWVDKTTLASVPAEEHAWAEGLSIAEAARRSDRSPAEFVLELLVATRLQTTAVFAPVPGRSYDEVRALVQHDVHMAGSDGIFEGGHPHPRAWGSFARLLGRHVRELGDLTPAEAAIHLSARTAARFGIGDRGRLAPGYRADIAVVDLDRVQDCATYAAPRELAVGVDQVLVNGALVLDAGRLTGVRSGQAVTRREGGPSWSR